MVGTPTIGGLQRLASYALPTVVVGANVTISQYNASTYNGAIVEFTGAFTITLAPGLPKGFGFSALPPASGNATIASGGATVLLNGATTSITRAAAANAAFAVIQRGTNTNSYVVTGS